MPNWTTITKQAKGNSSRYERYRDQLVVIVSASGDIHLTPAAHEYLGKATHAKLLYDAKAHLLGFRASSINEEDAFTIQSNPKSPQGMRRISSQQAFELGAGQPDCVVIYRAAPDASGVLVINLNQRLETIPAPVRHRNGNGNGKS